MTIGGPTKRIPILTVSQVTAQIKNALEGNFPVVVVLGEISSLNRAGSGHAYFSLVDQNAQLRCVCWRSTLQRFRFDLHDGLSVIAVGPLEVYAARGAYQLVVEQLEPRGIGVQELAFRKLYERLAAEGLFATERKRALPRYPRRIALVTSAAGAAVRDMIQVISRRWPAARCVVVPCLVQGDRAAADIERSLRQAALIPEVDVVITGRGGGSADDLAAFNDERVARAIFNSPVPVISAVGHEIDVTLADLVADRRALTPSEAAELVVPDVNELNEELKQLAQRMSAALRSRAAVLRSRVTALASSTGLSRPLDIVRDRERQLDELHQRMLRGASERVTRAKFGLGSIEGKLQSLDPLGVLSRGYSVTRIAGSGQIVRTPADVVPGTDLETLVAAGTIRSRVSE